MIALRPLREDEYAGWDAAHRPSMRAVARWAEESVHTRKQL